MENPIDIYISKYPKDMQKILTELRTLIKTLEPTVNEKISYGIPTFDLNGKHLVHFAGYKNHIGFYPTPKPLEAFKNELTQYKTSKGAIQLPLNTPLPKDLITKIVEFRIKDLSKN